MLHKIKLQTKYQTILTVFISFIVIFSASGYAHADSLNTFKAVNSSTSEVTKSIVFATDIDEADAILLKIKSGVFVGLADNHTMEITIKGEAVAIQFDEKLMSEIEELQENDHIKVKYTEQAVKGDTAIIRNLISIK